MKNIDTLPDLVKRNEITKEEALKTVAEEVFKNKKYFNLESYEEDFVSEIMLQLLEKGGKLFDKYDSSLCSFHTYTYIHVQSLIMTLERTITNRFVISKSRMSCAIEDFMEKTEPKLTIVEEKENNYSDTENTKIWKEMTKRSNSKYAVNEKTALVLALKSSYFMKSQTVNKVGSYCRLQDAEIQRMILELNSKIYSKIDKYNKIVASRNNAYFSRRKYVFQMEYFAKRERDLKMLKEQYDKKTKIWEKKNKELREGNYHICPSNNMIAKILGISERQVCYYLNRIRKIKDAKKKENAKANN